MKRTLSLLFLLLLFTGLFVSCGKGSSPFDHPEKYITAPDLSTIKVKNSDVEASYQDVMQDLLEDMTGEHFQKLAERNAVVQIGDKVHISYTGTPRNTNVTLSETATQAINAIQSDRVFVIPGAGEVSKAIEDILIGAKIGSELSVSVTYTENDTDIEDLIGQDINFVIKVHSISRLTVSSRHAVKLKYTAKLADGSAPLDTIAKLLEGGVETVDLSDAEDTFDEAFSVSEIHSLLIGKHKYDSFSFTLTLPAEKAQKYGYNSDVAIDFEATVNEAVETPTLLTDEMVESVTEGQFTTAAEYENYCRNQVKEQLALAAVAEAVTYNDDFPKDLYNEFYEENCREAAINYLDTSTEMTVEEIKSLLPESVLTVIESDTISELRERFLFEYYFDYFDLKLTDAEYQSELEELYKLYQTEYYYALIYYNITNLQDFETYFGKEYLEVQFLYEKLPPLLRDAVQYIDE